MTVLPSISCFPGMFPSTFLDSLLMKAFSVFPFPSPQTCLHHFQKSFPSIKDISFTDNEGLIPITMLPFIKLDLIFTSWSRTSKRPISTREISTFASIKLFSGNPDFYG